MRWFLIFTFTVATVAVAGDEKIESKARMDIAGTVNLRPVENCFHPGWRRDKSDYLKSLSANSEDLINDVWTDFTISFIPEEDGEFDLRLMGRDGRMDPLTGKRREIWVYFDSVSIEGAEVKNGGFEEVDEKGNLLYWAYGPPLTDSKIAESGNNCVAVWHNRGCVLRNIKVKKNIKIVIKAKVKESKT